MNSQELRKFYVEKIAAAEDLLVLSHEGQMQANKNMQENISEIKRVNRETEDAIAKTFDKVISHSCSSKIWIRKLGSIAERDYGNHYIDILSISLSS
jgi:hypothetical protein